MNTTNTERTVVTTTTAARWVRNQGGDRIAQENAAIMAKRMLQAGKSAASAIDAGFKSGMKTIHALQNPQAMICDSIAHGKVYHGTTY